jgi:hypothetical protein
MEVLLVEFTTNEQPLLARKRFGIKALFDSMHK